MQNLVFHYINKQYEAYMNKYYLIFQISIKVLPSEISKLKSLHSLFLQHSDGKLQEGDKTVGIWKI